MKANEIKLLLSKSVNRLGDVLYDYGNSSWLASFGQLGKSYLGIYQMVDVVISVLTNPFGGVLADRLKRRKILLTTDAFSTILCLLISFIQSDNLLVYGLIGVNILLAISTSFSGPAYRSYVPEVVKKEDIVSYNSHLETISQVIKVASPIIGLFVYSHLGIRLTLILDSLTFAISFLCLYFIKEMVIEDKAEVVKEKLTVKNVLEDIKSGLIYIQKEKEIFFLLLLAALVNLFIAILNYVLPFTPQLFHHQDAYASVLSFGASGTIVAALIASKMKSTMNSMLIMTFLSGLSLSLLTIAPFFHLPIVIAYLGNFFFECFLTIFNVHFFSQVQTRVAKEYMGRVIATIYTIAIVLMPLGIGMMLIIPASVSIYTFSFVALAIMIMSILGKLYLK